MLEDMFEFGASVLTPAKLGAFLHSRLPLQAYRSGVLSGSYSSQCGGSLLLGVLFPETWGVCLPVVR